MVWDAFSSLTNRNLSLVQVDQYTRVSIFSNTFSDSNHSNPQINQSTLDSLQALISNDPTDAMNPIFQDILDQYINVMNMDEQQLTAHAANMGLHDNNSL